LNRLSPLSIELVASRYLVFSSHHVFVQMRLKTLGIEILGWFKWIIILLQSFR